MDPPKRVVAPKANGIINWLPSRVIAGLKTTALRGWLSRWELRQTSLLRQSKLRAYRGFYDGHRHIANFAKHTSHIDMAKWRSRRSFASIVNFAPSCRFSLEVRKYWHLLK